MRPRPYLASYTLIAWIVLAGRSAYAGGIGSPNWGASSVITPVRMIIFILALTAIGWFVSRIDTASNSDLATTTISETMPAPTESAPAIPLARPKLDGDDTATVLAASTTPTGGTPPKPLAKPELYDDDATTVPAAETTPASTQEVPPIPPAKPELYGDDTTTVLAAETTPASTLELVDVGMETSPAIETTTAPTTNTTRDMLANFVDSVERRDDEIIVDVPTTHVETSGDKKTRVKVRAPYTKIDVDTKRRMVRIRVPYYNGDIRW